MTQVWFQKTVLAVSIMLAMGVAKAQDLSSLPQPEDGDVVCRAYVSEYRPFGNRLAGDLHLISNLPQRYCRTGRALDGSVFSMVGRRLRVVAVGDFYQYSDGQDQATVYAQTVNPDYSEIACHARAITPEGDLVSFSHLQEADCYSGATFRIAVDGTIRWVQVETAYDFHYVPREDLQIAEPLEEDSPSEEIVPAVYSVEI